ncbi:signal peptidase II [Dyadobacter tibetensis]|uniref:signal peptidase II n=1 Tax=Dyadobacter tibetensis TaxID=1211851 RepID=UPI00046FE7BF|nr:signal peptidase II [Dyadobacter tibetensis]
MRNNYLKNTLIIFVLLCNLGCDQITKNMAREEIDEYQIIPIVERYFTLTKVENKGAFLSIGSDMPEQVKLILLSLIPLGTLLFGLYYIFVRKDLNLVSGLALAFAIGGGLGNIYDRLFRGSVTDFMHMDFVFFQTGIFNMADVSIMVGMLLFFSQSLIGGKKKPNIYTFRKDV